MNTANASVNDADGIDKLVAWLKPFAPRRVVFEATGLYQRPAVAALLLAVLPAACLRFFSAASMRTIWPRRS